MCQVCENPYRICEFVNNGFYINKMDNGEYRFKMKTQRSPLSSRQIGYDVTYSTPISYCPYCGRDLTTEVEPPQTYWKYLKTLDSDSDICRTLLNLGQKWQKEGKDLDYELKKYMNW